MTITTPTLAVTGSTGALGGTVARLVAEADVSQRLLVRTVAKAPALPGATPAPFSYDDRTGPWSTPPARPASDTSSTRRSTQRRRTGLHPGARPLGDGGVHQAVGDDVDLPA